MSKEMTESEIIVALKQVEKGLRKYCWIQDHLYRNDVSKTREFQKTYNGFYRIRRKPEWQAVYYRLMERSKSEPADFERVLLELRQKTGNMEASFASKLVATIFPDRPVIDRFVLKYFGLHLPWHYEEDREAKTVWVYEQLTSKYAGFLSSSIAQNICEKFRASYPWADITDIKKVELVLWQTREP